METLLAWQPPRTNGSRYLCSLLCLTIFNNTGEREREGGGVGGRRVLIDKESTWTCVCVGGARRVGMTCSLENNDIVLNYNVMCMHWNSTLMIYTHSSYFTTLTSKKVFSVHVWMMTSYYDSQSVFSVSQCNQPKFQS